MDFEVRLEGGRVFHIGYLPPGPKGGLTLKSGPEFCREPEFCGGVETKITGVWMLRSLDEFFDSQELRNLCRPVAVTDRSPGVAVLNFAGNRPNLSIFLSPLKIPRKPLSILDDWSRIIVENKDDASRDVSLRLEFDDLTPGEMGCLRAGKELATTTMGLQVGASDAPWLWARDD